MNTPPGWYPCPNGSPETLRYWDGTAWTEHAYRTAGPAAGAPGQAAPWPGGPSHAGASAPARRKGYAYAAVTGAVIGVLLLLLLGVAVIRTVRSSHVSHITNVPVVRVPIGQTVDVPPGQRFVGTARITVYSLVVPYTGPSNGTDAGTVPALAEAQICAGSSGANLSDSTVWIPLPFHVILADGRQITLEYKLYPDAPELQNKIKRLGANQCLRGYLDFAVPTPSTVVGVGYSGTQHLNDLWLLPDPVVLASP